MHLAGGDNERIFLWTELYNNYSCDLLTANLKLEFGPESSRKIFQVYKGTTNEKETTHFHTIDQCDRLFPSLTVTYAHKGKEK